MLRLTRFLGLLISILLIIVAWRTLDRFVVGPEAVCARPTSQAQPPTTSRPIPIVETPVVLVQRCVSRLSGDRLTLGRVEGLLIIAIVIVLLRRVVLRIRGRRPGPVQISDIEDATGQLGADLKGIRAMIEDSLAGFGLLPPGPPTSVVRYDFLSVAEASPVPNIKWLASLLNLLRDVLAIKPGHTIAATASRQNDLCAVTVRVTRVPGGKVEDVRTVTGQTFHEAAEKAASFIIQQVLNHPQYRRTVPRWSRWSPAKSESFWHYLKGLELKERDDPGALDEFKLAARLQPANVLIQLEIGSQYEEQGQFLNALETYLDTARLWRDVIEVRYRLFATLSFVEIWLPRLTASEVNEQLPVLVNQLNTDKRLESDDRRETKELLAIGSLLNRDDKNPERFFLDLAKEQLDDLQKMLRRRSLLWKWLRTYVRRIKRYEPDDRRYWQSWIDRRTDFTKALDVAKILMGYLLDLERHTQHAQRCKDEHTKQAERLMQQRRAKLMRRGIGWQARYNAACLYSIVMEDPPLESSGWNVWVAKSERYAERALVELAKVVRDPTRDIDPKWLELDPALSNLRSHPRARTWFKFLAFEAQPTLGLQSRPTARRRDGIRWRDRSWRGHGWRPG
jgi:hypothetical protein